jgi:ADP-ribose pyrophosphatase
MEIFRGRKLWIEEKRIQLPNGVEKDSVIVHPKGAVAILPVTETGYLLLRQYRYAVGQYIWEAPAGTLEDGEAPIETARRELIEEAGVAAGSLIPKGFIYTTDKTDAMVADGTICDAKTICLLHRCREG